MLVLLTSWLDMPVQNKAPFQVLEYYAGVARIATLAKFLGLRSAAVDIEYGKHNKPKSKRPPMDINSDAGLMWLGIIWTVLLFFFQFLFLFHGGWHDIPKKTSETFRVCMHLPTESMHPPYTNFWPGIGAISCSGMQCMGSSQQGLNTTLHTHTPRVWGFSRGASS